MKVTGNSLRTALSGWQERKMALAKLLKDNVWSFDPISEADPKHIINLQNKLAEAVEAVCALQELQQLYNTLVQVNVPVANGELRPARLGFVVKMVGELGAMKANWRRIALDSGREDRYRYSPMQKSTDEQFAVKNVDDGKAYQISSELGKQADAFRTAMSAGNAIEVDLDVSDESLLNPPTALL